MTFANTQPATDSESNGDLTTPLRFDERIGMASSVSRGISLPPPNGNDTRGETLGVFVREIGTLEIGDDDDLLDDIRLLTVGE